MVQSCTSRDRGPHSLLAGEGSSTATGLSGNDRQPHVTICDRGQQLKSMKKCDVIIELSLVQATTFRGLYDFITRCHSGHMECHIRSVL